MDRSAFEECLGEKISDRAWSKVIDFFPYITEEERDRRYLDKDGKLSKYIITLLECIDPTVEEETRVVGLTLSEYRKAWELRIGKPIQYLTWAILISIRCDSHTLPFTRPTAELRTIIKNIERGEECRHGGVIS